MLKTEKKVRLDEAEKARLEFLAEAGAK